MKKKFVKKVSVLLSILLFGFVISCVATKTTQDTLVVEGYKLQKVQQVPMVQGTAYVFEHIKSGAQIMYVQNDDTNLTFNVALSTPPDVSKGLNHILEHMMLSSSKEYPGKEVFFGAAKTTLNTYMNAATYPTYTIFPVSTTNELQFTQLADFYMSSVFEPTLDEFTFMREGWRYDLPKADDALIIKGIVYSEMQGANANILRAVLKNATTALFPDTVVKNDSGGTVENIPQLTLKEIQEYHAKYFVPSNSIIGIYGNLDVKAFLAFLDKKWLSNYTKSIELQKIAPQKPFTNSKNVTVEFAAPLDTPILKKSAIAKSFAISGLTEKEIPAFMLYMSILDDDSSPLKQSLKKSGLADSYFINFNPATRQTQFDVLAQNITPQNAQQFEKIVLEELAHTAKTGFEADLFDSVKAQYYAQGLLARENVGIGVELMTNMAEGQIVFGTAFAFATAPYDVQNVTLEQVKAIAQKYFVRNNHSALVTVNPVPGLTEQLAQQETARLAAIKEKMTSAQIEDLVKQTANFTAWLNAPDTLGQESLKKLQVLRPNNLTNTLEKVIITDTQKNGIRNIFTPVGGKVAQTQLIINLSNLSKEELLYAKVFARLLGSLNTDKLTYVQAGNQLSINTLGYSFSVSSFFDSYLRTASYPVFTINWLSEEKNHTAAQKIIETVLFETKLDTDLVKTELARLKSEAERSLQSGAISLSVQMSKAAVSYPYVLQDYLNGLPYIQFIIKVSNDFETNPKKVLDSFNSVRSQMLSKNGVMLLVAANEFFSPDSIISRLKDGFENPPKNYAGLSAPAKREAVIIQDTVSYSAQAQVIQPQKRMIATVASDILANEYYTPKIRLEGGAYGGYATVDRTVFVAYSVRDPNLDATLQTFAKTSSYKSELTLEKAVPYIVSRYGIETAPQGQLVKANTAMVNYIRGYTPQMKYEDIETLKKLTPQEIQSFIQTLFTQNTYAVFGSKTLIDNSKMPFETVVNMTKQ